MIILSSNGLSSLPLIEEAKKYITDGMKTAAIITTASVGYKEKDWNIPRLAGELEALGLAVECFDIEYQPAELLFDFDVILIGGGNPFYLLKQMNQNNCRPVFERLIKDKIVIGVSAGSVVMQKSINLIAQYSPEMNQDINLTNLSGLGLVDIEILPHYTRCLSRFERFEERAKEYELKNKCNVLRIDDGQGVFVGESYLYVV